MKKCLASYIFIILTVISISVRVSAKDNKLPVEGSGYVGTLPDLNKGVSQSNSHSSDNASENDDKSKIVPIQSKDFNSENEIKPVPDDNPAFVNIILKPDKSSKYAKDVYEIIPILEEIYDLIEDDSGVQLFNAKVYYFNKCSDYFRDKYKDKPESGFISYKKLMDLNIHSRSVALLRTEAKKFNPYLTYSGEGYIYDPNNINEQLNYLKKEIQQVILILREVN